MANLSPDLAILGAGAAGMLGALLAVRHVRPRRNADGGRADRRPDVDVGAPGDEHRRVADGVGQAGLLRAGHEVVEEDAEASPGDEVFDAADASQPAGMVVNAAARQGDPTVALLVEVKLAAVASGGGLQLGRPGGPVLRRAALPYDVPLTATDETAGAAG